MLKDVRLLWFCSAIIIISGLAITPFHELLPYLWWRFLHIVSAAMYSGVVVISAIFEWRVAQGRSKELFALYQELVTSMDKRLITISLSSLMTSAIALMSYRGLALWRMDLWPIWASAALIILSMTGLVWAIFDLRTQKEVSALLKSSPEINQSSGEDVGRSDELMRVLHIRHYVNIFSVSTIPVLYLLMVFKPH